MEEENYGKCISKYPDLKKKMKNDEKTRAKDVENISLFLKKFIFFHFRLKELFFILNLCKNTFIQNISKIVHAEHRIVVSLICEKRWK